MSGYPKSLYDVDNPVVAAIKKDIAVRGCKEVAREVGTSEPFISLVCNGHRVPTHAMALRYGYKRSRVIQYVWTPIEKPSP